MTILCADVGGTKTLLGLARLDPASQRIRVLHAQRYVAAVDGSFDAMLARFLADSPADLTASLAAACFAAAGPVSTDGPQQSLQMTNLPWHFDAMKLSQRLRGIPVRLANDFEAAASGIDALSPADLSPVQEGQRVEGAPQLVIGAGTGLGVAFRVWRAGRYEVLSGEGGHIGFSPLDSAQDEVMRKLRPLVGRVVAEHVVSGPGLANLYLCLGNEPISSTTLSGALQGLTGEEVFRKAMEHRDARALQALDHFLRCYGAVTGDHALSSLARGGVFLAGGIAQKLGPLMRDGRFIQGLHQKGPYAALMATLPVHVVTAPDLGLLGAAVLGSRVVR